MEIELEDLWNNLSLTKDEQHKIVIDKNWVEEVAHAMRNYLIGKMILKRAVNLEAMKTILQEVWKLAFGLVIKEVGDKVFVFQFEDSIEKDRIRF